MSPDLHHLSGAYAVDALDADERAAFEQHLAACTSCQAEVAELTDTAHALAALDEATPPPQLRAAILSSIQQVRPLPPLAGEAPNPVSTPTDAASGGSDNVIPLFRRTTTWLAAAAAAVILTVGGLAWHPWSSATDGQLDAVRQAQDASTVTSSKGGVTTTLAFSRHLGRSAITVTGLSAAPSGKTYQLWYIPASGAPRSAGFLETRDSRGSALLAGDIGDASAVGITEEPAGGSAAPTSDPIVVLALA